MKKITYYQYNELPNKVKNILLKEYDIDSELFEHSLSSAVVLDITDSVDCLKQYKLYMKKKGDIYERDPYKVPSDENFVKLYFGEYDDYDLAIPDIYICKNKNRAKELYNILQGLSYHDTFRQTYTRVELFDNVITVFGGSY